MNRISATLKAVDKVKVTYFSSSLLTFLINLFLIYIMRLENQERLLVSENLTVKDLVRQSVDHLARY